ncbi:CPBP family intramembrane glutamic endopeptidase [Oceanobacillus sp. J11TS1]|uniref:CPBP family intramembrane glutamic endopeptidase n=1 Tax=Oceanobacillus sp. J11TS1 TaxID=2807191 RepID=UPI001B240037|nr:CPBP family intramembrane glutamic endopeptidase [Oceanobacillus sp. J11TS1]GIO25191.1 membrane protein [Oceanobacillus sp. J11TS1]
MDWISWLFVAVICLPGVYFMYHAEKIHVEDDITDGQRLFAHLLTVILFSGLGAFAAYRVGFYIYSNNAIITGFLVGIVCSIIHFMMYYGYLKPKISPNDYDEIETHYRQTGILTRVFYGGFLEEVIFRWGLLSLFVWILQLVGLDNHFSLYTSVFVTSLLFAIVHIPSIKLVATKPKKEIYVYTIVGNIWVGLCASYAFIESGLIAAIIVHILFHLTWYPIQSFLYYRYKSR